MKTQLQNIHFSDIHYLICVSGICETGVDFHENEQGNNDTWGIHSTVGIHSSVSVLEAFTCKQLLFVLFTWSQYGRLAPRMTILFLNLQITGSDIRPHIKWAVSPVIADGHFVFHRVCAGMYGLTNSLYHIKAYQVIRP